MDDKTNKIKEWVENLKAQANTIPNLGVNSLAGFMLACDDVIAFIDSLQEEPASEDLEEAARKWEDKVYLENGWQDECGTPHAPFSEIGNAFIAGAEWQKQQMKESLQTEYEKGRFDMMEEIEKGAVEFAKSYMEDANPSFEKVQESEELWKWKISCLRAINKAYKQGKQDALKDLPKLDKTNGLYYPEIPIMYTHTPSMKSYVEYHGYKLCINDAFEKLQKEE